MWDSGPSRILRRDCRLPRLGGVAVAVIAGLSILVPQCLAQLTPRQGREVAALGSGVVWVDQETDAIFQSYGSGDARLGRVGTAEPQIASSDTSVAMLTPWRGFRLAIPPRPLAPVKQIPGAIFGGECEGGWVPMTGAESDFAVSDHELLVAGECQSHWVGECQGNVGEPTFRQPLFVHDYQGRWRVLRWLPGHCAPVLATEGDLLAAGVELPSGKMRVTTLNVATGRKVAGFDVRLPGYLGFASRRRLVVSVPESEERTAEMRRSSERHEAVALQPHYQVELFSLYGRRVAGLGVRTAPPEVSDMHVLADERLVEEPFAGDSALIESSLLGGPARRILGFNEPARSVVATAFRWPAVAAVETTSSPLAPGEVTCTSRVYHESSAPFLSVFDLAQAEPYVPPPASKPPARPSFCPIPSPPRTG
jgi:hypothetical protein